jgi:replicative DNA helicase
MSELSDYKKEFFSKIAVKVKGLHTGFTRLEKHTLGALDSNYVLIGGSSGSGKTTLMDAMLLRICKSAFDANIPIFIKYYSLEIPKNRKIAKLISLLLLTNYKIEISDMDILNFSDLDTSIYKEKIEECYDLLDKYLINVDFTFEATSYIQFGKDLKKIADLNGEFIKDNYGKTVYKKYAESSKVFIFFDHLGLAEETEGLSKKNIIDKLSKCAVKYRNLCSFSFYLVQQFNRNVNNIERIKYSGVDLRPDSSDFSDSSCSYHDSDQVFALFNPYAFNLEETLNYNMAQFKGYFRALFVLKNRFGIDNAAIGLLFKGKSNYIRELPPAEEINDNIIKALNI